MGRIYRHGRVDSTNERAFEALARGTARDGDVHVARDQTAGRGRLGRRWESAPGEGLYLSYIHLPASSSAPPPPPAITMAAGLALLDAVRDLGLERARLDWPNDLVVDDAKLAGILVESRGLDPVTPHFVVGIGVNVSQRSFSVELRRERAVTSLAIEGVDTSPDGLLASLLPLLDERLRQMDSDRDRLAADYLSGTGLEGANITVESPGRTLRGTLLGVDLERGLKLGTGDRVCWIEISHVRGLVRAPR